MYRGVWQTTVHGVCKELDTIEQLTLSLYKSDQKKKKKKNHLKLNIQEPSYVL